VADEVWIATALLHREQPGVADFSLKEIEDRLVREGLTDKRPGIYRHVSVHCVANRPPVKGRHRMLFETAPSRRRLFRRGDPYHPDREGGKILPDRTEIPSKYHALLDWYEKAPDAIQLACAAAAGVDLFITNDDRLSRKHVPEVKFITSLERAYL
jgi:hypothetical protein